MWLITSLFNDFSIECNLLCILLTFLLPQIQEAPSKRVVAGSPLNYFPSLGTMKESVSSAYVTLCSVLEKHDNLKADVSQQLLELKSKLECATHEIEALECSLEELKQKNEQENKEKSEEISNLSEKLEHFKQEQLRSDDERDVRLNKLELKSYEQSTCIASMQKQLSLIGHDQSKLDLTSNTFRAVDLKEEKHTFTIEDNRGDVINYTDDEEAKQQMEERRQKRLSVGHLEDSFEKMREFASTKPSNRDRIDSGVSLNSCNSVTGLILDIGSGSSDSSVPAQQ